MIEQVRDPNLILDWHNDSREPDDYKMIEEGDTYELEYPQKLPNKFNPEITEEFVIGKWEEGLVLEVDDDWDNKRALMRFTDEDDEHWYRDIWVPFSEIEADVNWTWLGEDESDDWDLLKDELTEYMEEKWGKGPWYLRFEGHDMGWTHASGWLEDWVEDGPDLIRHMQPKNTEFSLTVWHDDTDSEKRLRCRLAHHDAPTGETYYVWPVPEEEDDDEDDEY